MVDPSLAHLMTARNVLILKSFKPARTFLLNSVSVVLIRIAGTKGKPRNMKLIKKKRHLVIRRKYYATLCGCNNSFLKLHCAFPMMSNHRNVTEIVVFWKRMSSVLVCSDSV